MASIQNSKLKFYEVINEKVFESFVRKNTQGFNRMALSFNAMPTDFGSYPLSIYYKIESDSIAASLFNFGWRWY